jgi:hypothetical protein
LEKRRYPSSSPKKKNRKIKRERDILRDQKRIFIGISMVFCRMKITNRKDNINMIKALAFKFLSSLFRFRVSRG